MQSAPPQPDYTAAAQAQGTANLEADHQSNLENNPNQVTPTGSLSYGAPDASGRSTVTTALSPAEQQKLQSSESAENYSLSALNAALPNMLKGLNGFTIAGAPQGTIDPQYGGTIQTSANLGNTPALQSQLDLSGQPALYSGSLYGPAGSNSATDAAYQQATQYLDPQFAQSDEKLKSDLANQGIAPGSQAYNDAMNNAALTKQQAYGNAEDQAQQQGLAAYTAQNQAGVNNNQAALNTASTAGNFANAARGSYIDQILSAMTTNNNAVGQNYSIGTALANLNNSAQAQGVNEQATQETLPINIMSALLSSGQVASPNVQAFSQNSNIQPAPIMQGAVAQGAQATAASNANSNLIGQGLGVGGKLISAGAFGI